MKDYRKFCLNLYHEKDNKQIQLELQKFDSFTNKIANNGHKKKKRTKLKLNSISYNQLSRGEFNRSENNLINQYQMNEPHNHYYNIP